MVITINWQLDVDDSDGETLQDCIRIAKNEMGSQLESGSLSAEDFTYTARPDIPSIYQPPINEKCCRAISMEEFLALKKGDMVVFKEYGEYRINRVLKPAYNDRMRGGLKVETTDGWGDLSNLFVLTQKDEQAGKAPYKPEVVLTAVVHQYPEGDYGAWELPALTDEDAQAIDTILEKYSTGGCSVRSIDYNALFQ